MGIIDTKSADRPSPTMLPAIAFLLLCVGAYADQWDGEPSDLGLEGLENLDERSFELLRESGGGGKKLIPSICFNRSIDFEYEITGNCFGKIVNEKVLLFRSEWKDIGDCQLDFKMANPGYLRILRIGKTDNLKENDKLTYTGSAQVETEIDLDLKEKMDVESRTGSISFTTEEDEERRGFAFFLVLIPMARLCHQTIRIPEGSQKGRITYPGFDAKKEYAAGTFCDWRITAPPGYKIKLNFNDFQVGSDEDNCEGQDFIGVDTNADGVYDDDEKLCGQQIPDPVTSDGNQLNILGYGPNGDRGFCFNYELVEPSAP